VLLRCRGWLEAIPTEEPDADRGEEHAAEPHADIVARLLEYQRRLREETGGETAEASEGAWTPRRVEPDPPRGETYDEGQNRGVGRARPGAAGGRR
jgi:hypothetical protein